MMYNMEIISCSNVSLLVWLEYRSLQVVFASHKALRSLHSYNRLLCKDASEDSDLERFLDGFISADNTLLETDEGDLAKDDLATVLRSGRAAETPEPIRKPKKNSCINFERMEYACVHECV